MFSNRFSSKLARIGKVFLQHKCNVTTKVAALDEDDNPIIDGEGHPVYATTQLVNVPCLFLWREDAVTDERGNIVIKTPTLYFDEAEIIYEGDIVEDVRDKDNVTILLKSAKINTIDTTAEGGNPTLKVCILEGATI